MSEKIICSISHVCKEFPGVKALDDVNFDVREGEIHAIVGENGAGKSTLMNILSGVYKPTSGKIIFDGKEVSPNAPVEASALGIAMIHQELSLSHTLSVEENIFQARQLKGRFGLIDKKKLYAESRALLDQVGLKDMDPSTLVRNINVSQQQQVEIAKALSQNARFLILDEPTSALTPNETKVLFEIMAELKRKGFTMLYISHKLDEIMNISDRITVLRDGKYIGTLVTKETTITDMISMMVGREYSGGYTRAHYMDDDDYAKAKPLMEVKNLSVKGKVQDVSFTLYEGEVLGLAGLVGERFKNNEIFVPEMLVAAKAMKRGVEVLKPHLAAGEVGTMGKMIMGTVAGDLHDIGKNLVAMMIESAGFEVIDLGVDVPHEKFVQAVQENPGVKIVGLSALLTTTMPALRDAVALLNQQDFRKDIKVMVGGAPITAAFAEEIGADAYTPDAASSAQKAKELVG